MTKKDELTGEEIALSVITVAGIIAAAVLIVHLFVTVLFDLGAYLF